MTITPKIEDAIDDFLEDWGWGDDQPEIGKDLCRLIRMAQREAVKQATKRVDNRPEGYAE